MKKYNSQKLAPSLYLISYRRVHIEVGCASKGAIWAAKVVNEEAVPKEDFQQMAQAVEKVRACYSKTELIERLIRNIDNFLGQE